jgi:hypothetical protein
MFYFTSNPVTMLKRCDWVIGFSYKILGDLLDPRSRAGQMPHTLPELHEAAVALE